MEREKLISKLNIKDYNNQLERILSKKTFSEETKNLLLSMLYKIENSYEDYRLVTVTKKNKREILEEILQIISNDCDIIEITNNKDSNSFPEEKKIVTYLNTKKMLYEIYQIRQDKFEVQNGYEIIKPALEEIVNNGYSITSSEIIRDFDGWSWNISTKEIEDFTINLLYQILKILLGDDFLAKWQKENSKDNVEKLIDKLEKKYTKELSDRLFKAINQVAILSMTDYSKAEKDRLMKIQQGLQEEFNELDNKRKYINQLGKQKEKIVEKIKKIDSTISNDRQLKEEFISRNELLDMNHRIFSLSDLVEILENEREGLIEEFNKYSKKMAPLNFVKTKAEIENKLSLIKELELENDSKKTYNSKIKELLNAVNEAIKIQIDKAQEKETIIELIYKIRYYAQMYCTKNNKVMDMINLDNIQKMIITKSCKQKVITICSSSIKENYDIIKNIFKTDIIELEKIYFKLIKKDDKMCLEIYDEENMYKIIELLDPQEIKIKLNKKIKIFI